MSLSPELLSPAGNFEKLKIALAFGADAVYGGVSHFSLRIRSGKEFTYESFEEAVKYTHSHGKKIYATVNGFPFNSQIDLLKKHIQKLAFMNVDAFIVSTPGVIKLCKELAPHIDIHLSTQANVINYLDAEVYGALGVKRIIAAREVSLKDLVEIKKHLPQMELEVFVHGSMCFAYSGRCLISSLQSGRVPNRGSCANDCRFDYKLYVENPDNGTLMRIEEDEYGAHVMNAKDLNMSAHIKELIDSNVIDSLKIEGRTKSEYYAAITAKTYRQAIDDVMRGCFQANRYEQELLTTKNRGFFDGYLLSRPYEKNDSFNTFTAISDGSFEVVAGVREDGKYCLVKGILRPQESYELLLPYGTTCEEVSNEYGIVYKKDDRIFLQFNIIEVENGKRYESIHSGNTNPVKLPQALPAFSFFRTKSK